MRKENTGDRLKQIMNQRGLRQIDIINLCKPYCEKFGVKMGRNDISQYISGKAVPKQKKLTVLASALEVNEAWLMGYDIPMSRNKEQNKDEELDNIIKLLIKNNFSKEEKEEVIDYLNLILMRRNRKRRDE